MSPITPHQPLEPAMLSALQARTSNSAAFRSKATIILERYLQPPAGPTLTETFQQLRALLTNPDPDLMRARINGLTTETMYSMADGEPEPSDNIISHLLESGQDHYEFTDLVVEKARQIPYSHPAQIKFARLLSHLTPRTDDPGHTWSPCYPLPRPTTRALQPHWETVSFRERLESDSEITNLNDSWSRSVDIDDRFSGHVNFHAFLAHLGQFGFINTTHIAVCQLRQCFEHSPQYGRTFMIGGQIHDSKTAAAALNMELEDFDMKLRSSITMAAAMWILFNGSRLFSEVVRCPKEWHNDVEKNQFVAGSLFTGPILGLQRWTFWREGFEAVARGEGVDDKCAGLAAKAANVMQVLEDSMWH